MAAPEKKTGREGMPGSPEYARQLQGQRWYQEMLAELGLPSDTLLSTLNLHEAIRMRSISGPANKQPKGAPMSRTTAQTQWDEMVSRGIPERLCAQLIVSPEANDAAKFKERIEAAAEMSAIGRVCAKSMFGEDFNVEGCIEDFVMGGYTARDFREAAMHAAASADQHVNNTPPTRHASPGDPIKARQEQIDRLQKDLNRG